VPIIRMVGFQPAGTDFQPDCARSSPIGRGTVAGGFGGRAGGIWWHRCAVAISVGEVGTAMHIMRPRVP